MDPKTWYRVDQVIFCVTWIRREQNRKEMVLLKCVYLNFYMGKFDE